MRLPAVDPAASQQYLASRNKRLEQELLHYWHPNDENYKTHGAFAGLRA